MYNNVSSISKKFTNNNQMVFQAIIPPHNEPLVVEASFEDDYSLDAWLMLDNQYEAVMDRNIYPINEDIQMDELIVKISKFPSYQSNKLQIQKN